MANITSKGLHGLSHFSTSRISRSLDEPVYRNLWTAEIQLPESIGADSEQINLLLEGLQKVSGLDTTKVPGAVGQMYKSSDRSFAGGGPENTYLDIKLDFEINVQDSGGSPTMTQLRTLRKWCDLVYDPLTGRMGIKRDYVAPQMVVTLHDKNYNPLWIWTLYNVFPITGINAVELDYTNKNDLYKVSDFTLRCDYWTESIA